MLSFFPFILFFVVYIKTNSVIKLNFFIKRNIIVAT